MRIADRTEAFLARQGYGRDEPGDADEGAEDDALALIQSAAIAGRSATRRGRKASRLQLRGGRPFQLPPRCASCDGTTVHAGVVIGAKDRQGLERLCRYIARPPLAKPRVEALPNGRVHIHLKRAWSDGTAAIELSRMELAEHLVALDNHEVRRRGPTRCIPAVEQHGVLASRSRLRDRVRPELPRAQPAPASVGRRLSKKPRGRSRWTPWATLLWRVFGAVGFDCPCCSRTMKLRAVLLHSGCAARDAGGPGVPGAVRQGAAREGRRAAHGLKREERDGRAGVCLATPGRPHERPGLARERSTRPLEPHGDSPNSPGAVRMDLSAAARVPWRGADVSYPLAPATPPPPPRPHTTPNATARRADRGRRGAPIGASSTHPRRTTAPHGRPVEHCDQDP